ncbi:MAG TPA: PAS domain-containing protein [Candidatus Saccharimonadia bacterium]|nr:PAS domain-containing protein [Candidatus Saccharimonadia bacterium]
MEPPKIDAEELWKVAWTYIQTVVDTVREPFLVLDENLQVLSANKIFYAFFQVTPEETEGKRVYELGNGQWSDTKLSILLEDILPKNTFFTDFKVEHTFPRIGHKIMLLNARRIYKTGEERPIMLLAMEDITKQKELEEQLRSYAKRLNFEVAKRTAQLERRVRELEKTDALLRSYQQQVTELRKELEEFKKSNQ